MAADVHAEDRVRLLARVVGPVGELDPSCLAAAAREHLSLHDDLATELRRVDARLVRRRRQAALGDRDAEAREEMLALVLVEIHAAGDSSELPSRAAPG